MGAWEDLKGRLSVVFVYEGGEPRTSRPQDLDDFEAEFGMKLPASYRDYALAIGPGEIGGNGILIFAPGFPESATNDLSAENRQWRRDVIGAGDDASLARSYGDAARARRLVFFGRVLVLGRNFAWDLGEVTDPDGGEYAIYLVDADRFGEDAAEKVASTFREFLTEFALGHEFARRESGERPTGPSDWDTPGLKISFAQVIVAKGPDGKKPRGKKSRRSGRGQSS